MAAIAIGAVFMCCVCSAVGGGGYLYIEEQKRQDRIKTALMTQGVTWFEECNFKGGIVMENIFELPISPDAEFQLKSIGAKSFIVGPNVKLVFYRDEERTDAVETITVPMKYPCNGSDRYQNMIITPII